MTTNKTLYRNKKKDLKVEVGKRKMLNTNSVTSFTPTLREKMVKEITLGRLYHLAYCIYCRSQHGLKKTRIAHNIKNQPSILEELISSQCQHD